MPGSKSPDEVADRRRRPIGQEHRSSAPSTRRCPARSRSAADLVRGLGIEGAQLHEVNGHRASSPIAGLLVRARASSPVSQPEPHQSPSEEIFGPVLAVMTLPHARGSHRPAPTTRPTASAGGHLDGQGLASILSRSLRRLRRRRHLVPTPTTSFDAASSPFGGYKESGFGREGGLQGLAPYLALDS